VAGAPPAAEQRVARGGVPHRRRADCRGAFRLQLHEEMRWWREVRCRALARRPGGRLLLLACEEELLLLQLQLLQLLQLLQTTPLLPLHRVVRRHRVRFGHRERRGKCGLRWRLGDGRSHAERRRRDRGGGGGFECRRRGRGGCQLVCYTPRV